LSGHQCADEPLEAVASRRGRIDKSRNDNDDFPPGNLAKGVDEQNPEDNQNNPADEAGVGDGNNAGLAANPDDKNTPMFEHDISNESPVDPFAEHREDDDIDVPDNDPGGSIYAFLNATADPYRGPLNANLAAVLKDIYPAPATDHAGFYAAQRQLDPQHQRCRHSDLLVPAAASAPHERKVNVLAHCW
jgi:hypothetical protein